MKTKNQKNLIKNEFEKPKNKKCFFLKRNKAFTLIEILVSIAIIGALTAIVMPTLNSARKKGKNANVISNLRNIIPEMEVLYFYNGSKYGGINPDNGNINYPNTTCNGQEKVGNIISSIVGQGAIVRCLSMNNPAQSDIYQRWGMTALFSGTTSPLEAYSVSTNGVGKWDVQGVNTAGAFVTTDVPMTWDQATTACSLAGGRLPTIEELKTLADAYCQASGSTDCTVSSPRAPAGFITLYWSSITVPSNTNRAYAVAMHTGNTTHYAKTNSTLYAHCVR